MKVTIVSLALAAIVWCGSPVSHAALVTIDPTSDGSLYTCPGCNVVSDGDYVLTDGYIQGAVKFSSAAIVATITQVLFTLNPYGLPLSGPNVEVYGYGTDIGQLDDTDANAGTFLGTLVLPENLGYGEDVFFDVTAFVANTHAPFLAFNLRSAGTDVFSSLEYNYGHPSQLLVTTAAPEPASIALVLIGLSLALGIARHRSLRSVFGIIAVGLAATAMHPARATNSQSPFGVEFSDCVESIGVGLAPTPNVVALTPPGFIPVGLGTPVSPIVVRTADCAGIAVDGHKAKPGSVVQIGAVIVPPEIGVGDINNYTFWYYTTDERLAHRLRDLGVSAQHVETIDYVLEPGQTGIPNDLAVTVRRPGEPRFTLEGSVVPSDIPTGSFDALWWQKTSAGNIRMDTNVPAIAISSAALILETDVANALGRLIGGGTLGFPIVQQFNMFSDAHMDVRAAP